MFAGEININSFLKIIGVLIISLHNSHCTIVTPSVLTPPITLVMPGSAGAVETTTGAGPVAVGERRGQWSGRDQGLTTSCQW